MGQWTEQHPFKVALIVGVIASIFGAIYHKMRVLPNDWSGFLMYTPFLFVIPLSIAGLSYLSEKNKRKI
jgi:hypothetical protein